MERLLYYEHIVSKSKNTEWHYLFSFLSSNTLNKKEYNSTDYDTTLIHIKFS